jgi:hypothetical protein
MLNISSMLPDTIIDGTAETDPDINLPTTAPATFGVTPTIMQDRQYIRDADMYTDLHPKTSE